MFYQQMTDGETTDIIEINRSTSEVHVAANAQYYISILKKTVTKGNISLYCLVGESVKTCNVCKERPRGGSVAPSGAAAHMKKFRTEPGSALSVSRGRFSFRLR